MASGGTAPPVPPAYGKEVADIDPIVQPALPLTSDERVRYSRHLALSSVGEDGQRRLGAARVLSIGAGGLGSSVLQYLAAAGVGTIGVIDDDRVEHSNLQRQVIHGEPDVGSFKVDSAASAVARLNSGVAVRRHRERLTAQNAVDIVAAYDLVIDGSDNFATRYLVNDACAIAGIPYVWGSILGFEGQVSVFWQDAPGGLGRTYRDLHPQAPAPGLIPSCAEAGVVGSICGVVGSLMATEAVKLIVGIGAPLLGRVLVCDLLAMSMRQIPFGSRGLPPIRELAGDPAAASDPIADRTIDAREAQRWIAHRGIQLIDVREPFEARICAIEGARLVPHEQLTEAPADHLPADRDVLLYCKSGGRSGHALKTLRAAGYERVWHIDGGILAWIRDVDSSLTPY
ncbi:molybdopterin-synthase adenylyltransferase MoeB [Cumulibacter manganitolerans]|uniref:molybdopterin-synthase adenylyltransferase MoeB n=1 Tax=Cumulibacter manganitolerans TaxID=1884992 RepID=UPI001E5258F5|nr:molybdopterin-synthase adenylyltransferase MoeB [Cumulibacter manganitolerans]